MGKCPTISIDKTDGCQVYLSKQSISADIITAKSSEMTICIPQEDGNFVRHTLTHHTCSFSHTKVWCWLSTVYQLTAQMPCPSESLWPILWAKKSQVWTLLVASQVKWVFFIPPPLGRPTSDSCSWLQLQMEGDDLGPSYDQSKSCIFLLKDPLETWNWNFTIN